MAQNWNRGGYPGGPPQNQYNPQYNNNQYNNNPNRNNNNNNNKNNNQYRGGPPNQHNQQQYNANMNRGGGPNQYNNNNNKMNMNRGPLPNQYQNQNKNMNQGYNPNMNQNMNRNMNQNRNNYNNPSSPQQAHNQYNNNSNNNPHRGGFNQSQPPHSKPLQPPNKSKPNKSKPKPKPAPSPKKNNNREYDHLFKLVLIGDATVGKTSLLLRFADDSFKDNYISTIGVDFRFRTLTVDGELVKLQIWDTAGQERFRTITSAYYRGADGIILIYDITNHRSFEHVQDWLNEVHKVTGSSITKLIIGNKNDLQHQRQVNSNEAQQFAVSVGASIIETSAKTANNVDKSFTMIAQELVKRGKVARKSIVIRNADEDEDGEQKKKCCLI